jgi:hypothetical protein
LNGLHFALGASALLLGVLFLIWLITSAIGDKYGAEVYLVWYIFSFSMCLAVIAFYWIDKVGAFNEKGQAVSDLGKSFLSILNFSLDLEADFLGLLALVGLVVVPQIASYLLSGIFGCATRPRMVVLSVRFFSWGIAKACATASGVLLVLSLAGMVKHWDGFTAERVAQYIILVEMLLAFAFVMLLGKTTLDDIPVLASSPTFAKIRRATSAIDHVMTRRRVS